MNFEIVYVLICLAAMVVALIYDRMRPGMILFCRHPVFLCGNTYAQGSVGRFLEQRHDYGGSFVSGQ